MSRLLVSGPNRNKPSSGSFSTNNNKNKPSSGSFATNNLGGLIIPEHGGKLLQKMADDFTREQVASESKHKYEPPPPPPPDPVIFFPGGSADCGPPAKPSGSMSTWSVLALLLSIFNIVDILVSNANNNNNRNNINDNSDNVNLNNNAESNVNPGQASANQVMMTPPGVGRRKRAISQKQDLPVYLEAGLSGNNLSLTIFSHQDSQFVNITSSSFEIPSDPKTIQEELSLGLVMTLNTWHLMDAGINRCMRRSICELGLNGGYWGNLSAMLTQTAGGVLTRWHSVDLKSEQDLLKALNHGLQSANIDRSEQVCEEKYGDECPVWIWNILVNKYKDQHKEYMKPESTNINNYM